MVAQTNRLPQVLIAAVLIACIVTSNLRSATAAFITELDTLIPYLLNVWWAWPNILIIRTRIEHCWSHALMSLSINSKQN